MTLCWNFPTVGNDQFNKILEYLVRILQGNFSPPLTFSVFKTKELPPFHMEFKLSIK